MGQKQDSLDRQLARANEDLQNWVGVLDERGIPEADRKRDPRWRSLDSTCRRLRRRLAAVADLAAREEECQKRKESASED